MGRAADSARRRRGGGRAGCAQIAGIGLSLQKAGEAFFDARQPKQTHWAEFTSVADHHLSDLAIFHGGVAGGEIHSLIDEVLNARPAALGLIIDRHPLGLLAEILELGRVNRERKAGPGTGQAQILGCRCTDAGQGQ